MSGSAPLDGARVAVVGLGERALACLRALCDPGGAGVWGYDSRPELVEHARVAAGGDLCLETHTDPVEMAQSIAAQQPDGALITAGFPQESAVREHLNLLGIAVWSEAEVAWRLSCGLWPSVPWLTVGGAVGKTTVLQLAHRMFKAAGLLAIVAGGAGKPLVTTVLGQCPDVLLVELDQRELSGCHTLKPLASACLNILSTDESEIAQMARVYNGTVIACLYDPGREATREMVEMADVSPGARAVGITRAMPTVGQVGMVEDIACERAFFKERWNRALELFTVQDLGSQKQGGNLPPHVLTNALFAAALVRAYGVEPAQVRKGLLSAVRMGEVGL